VRGVASKSLSHALVTPDSPFPQLLISRGHVLDTLGITVRPPGGGKGRIELLPEEALYLAERGSLQIWNGSAPTPEEPDLGTWSDVEFGVRGAVEMSVLEVFGAFMGREGLSWQRYQAYAYLKRLGYTVQRTRRFIPTHFLPAEEPVPAGVAARMAGLWACLCSAVRRLVGRVRARLPSLTGGITGVGLALGRVFSSNPLRATILGSWSGQTYCELRHHVPR
jgi:tRNA-splicing endonuclease subunit Sen54